MENNLRKYLNLAGKYISQEKIFSEEELRSAINKASSQSQLWRKIKMTVISASIIGAIISVALLSGKFGDNPAENSAGSPETKAEITMESKSEDHSNTNTIMDNVNKNDSNSADKPQNIIKNKPDKENIRIFTIKRNDDTDPEKLKEWKEKNKGRYFRLDVEGLRMLTMSVREFERLVPDFRLNDTTFYTYREKYVGRKTYESRDLAELGYPDNEFPLLVKKYTSWLPSRIRFGLYMKYGDWDNDDYSRTLYPIVVRTENGKARTYIENDSPLFMHGDELFSEYYDFMANESMRRWKLHKSNDTIGLEKMDRYRTELQRIVYSRLVPVKMKRNEDEDFIFFFVPNEEFLAKVPDRYRDQLRREIAIMNRIQKEGAPAYEACKGFDAEQSYLDICRIQSGAVGKMSVYPNPARGSAKCSYILSEERRVNVSIHDINGNNINTISNNVRQMPGEHEFILDLSDLPSGMYLIAVRTNESEQVISRLIVNK